MCDFAGVEDELLFPALGRIGRKYVLEVLHKIQDIVFGGIPTAHQAGATASDKLVKAPAQAAQLRDCRWRQGSHHCD